MLVDRLQSDCTLARYHWLPATRADLLRRLGCDEEAAQAYREALELAPTDAEQRFLRRRLAQVEGDPRTVRRRGPRSPSEPPAGPSTAADR